MTASAKPRAAGVARRLVVLRTRAAEALREGEAELAKLLRDDYGLDGEAMRAIAAHFAQQESVSEIPDAATLLIEDGLVRLRPLAPPARAGPAVP